MNSHKDESNILKFLPLFLLISGCATGLPNDTGRNIDISGPNSYDARNNTTYPNAPIIVMQSGLGDGKEVWDAVAPELSKNYTVVAFDRPGHSQRPSTDSPRDPCTIASEQREMLQSMKLSPPYILVGHSLGGIYQYAFAKLYPNEVAGMVLVDPTPPDHWQTMQREVPESALIIKGLREIAFSETDRREFDDQSKCLDHLNLAVPTNSPSEILVAGKFSGLGEGADFEAMVRKSRLQWLEITSATELHEILDSGHYIQKESPADVVFAINRIAYKKEF